MHQLRLELRPPRSPYDDTAFEAGTPFTHYNPFRPGGESSTAFWTRTDRVPRDVARGRRVRRGRVTRLSERGMRSRERTAANTAQSHSPRSSERGHVIRDGSNCNNIRARDRRAAKRGSDKAPRLSEPCCAGVRSVAPGGASGADCAAAPHRAIVKRGSKLADELRMRLATQRFTIKWL